MTSNGKTNIYTRFFDTETLDAVPIRRFDECIDGVNTRQVYLHTDRHTENTSEHDNLLYGELTDLDLSHSEYISPSEFEKLW